jgi:hypothetical protein
VKCCCDPCGKANGCDPCGKVEATACDPCAKVEAVACDPCTPACDPARGKAACCKKCRRPLLAVLDGLFGKRCCKPNCCANNGCCGTGADNGAKESDAKAATGTAAAPLPLPPRVDPSASLQRSRSIYQTSRALARN